MNKDILEGKWEQLKGVIQSKWGEITDNELTQIKGDTKRLNGILQEKYGIERQEAERMYKEIFSSEDYRLFVDDENDDLLEEKIVEEGYTESREHRSEFEDDMKRIR